MPELDTRFDADAGAPVGREPLKTVLERFERNFEHPEKRQWYLNLAFLVGNQYVKWDSIRGTLFEPKAPSWRVRLVLNHILPRVRTEFAKLTINRHVWEVLPATGEERDVNTAKVATKWLDAKWRELEMDDVREEVVLNDLVFGNGFIKTWWDPDQYADTNTEPQIDPETGEPVTDENGNSIMTPRMSERDPDKFMPLGDIAAASISPLEIIPDPHATCVADAQWIIHAKDWPVDAVEDKWGVRIAEAQQGEGILSRVKSMVMSAIGKTSLGQQEDDDMVTVKEMWERPSGKYPEGRLVIVAGDTLVYDGPNPMPDGDLPFVHIRHYPVPGKFWAMSVIQQLIPVQKEFNKTRSQIVEHKNRTMNPPLLIPSVCQIDERKITNEPGQRIVYNWTGGAKPEYVNVPALPGYISNVLEHLLNDFEQISGQHEVSHGQTPPGVKSGVAIRYLQEQDDTKLGPTARNIEKGWKRLAKLWLKLARANYHDMENRMVKVVGKNREVEVLDFVASQLPMEPDVIVISGSSMPESKAARQEFLKELFQMGAFVDPKTGQNDTQKFLKMLELGGSEEVFDDISTDINAAEMENRLMEQGQWQDVHEWDNTELHIYQHNKFRKSSDFTALPPEVRELFGRHIKIHEAVKTGMVPFLYSGEVDTERLMKEFQQGQQQLGMMGPPPLQQVPPDIFARMTQGQMRPQAPMAANPTGQGAV